MAFGQAVDDKDSILFVTEKELQASTPDASSDAREGAITASGEINWDCPCLGGLAFGPCGEQFRAAFSCFVYSEQEPKGIDCVDKFQTMQECFSEHPDVYADEIRDDDHDSELGPADSSEPLFVPPTLKNDSEAAFPVTDPTASSAIQEQ